MKEPKINIGNSQKERIVTKELIINQNVFIYNETIIPLNNISRIYISSEAKEPYQIIQFIMVIIGILFLFINNAVGIIMGLLLVTAGIWSICNKYKRNQELGEYLILNLNSGKDIYLYSKEHSFTVEIMDVIVNCINSEKEYKINMENCKIEACQFGEKNIMMGEKE